MTELIKRRRWSIEVWRELAARQGASGLSTVDFCARESINLSTFYRYRKLCGDEVAIQMPSVVAGNAVRSNQPAFVDLGSLRSNTSSLMLRLDLGEGLVLSLERR